VPCFCGRGCNLATWVSSTPYAGDADGGDIHYVSMCGAGRISRFAVADISGHGSAAGELAGRLRRLMRKHIRTPDQTAFAQAINDEFLRLEHGGHFATALLTTYSAPTDHLIICNAGHPRPMWYHNATQTWSLLNQDMPGLSAELQNLPLVVFNMKTDGNIMRVVQGEDVGTRIVPK